jgi:hypothetical protein
MTGFLHEYLGCTNFVLNMLSVKTAYVHTTLNFTCLVYWHKLDYVIFKLVKERDMSHLK